MNIGDSLHVILNSNPTTGYDWEISSIDTSVVRISGNQFESKKVSRGIVGAGGKRIFYFQANKKGNTALNIIYHRSFEKNKPAQKTYKLIIAVE